MRSPKPQTNHPPTTYSQGSRSEMTACLSLPNAMNRLLKLTAIIEASTGLGLIAVPAIVVRLLLDAEITGAIIPLGRVTGLRCSHWASPAGLRVMTSKAALREDWSARWCCITWARWSSSELPV